MNSCSVVAEQSSTLQTRGQQSSIAGLSDLGTIKGFSNACFSSTAEFILAG